MKSVSIYRTELCVVCLDEPTSQVLMPCQHLCLCNACAPEIVAKGKCPLCRTVITETIETDESNIESFDNNKIVIDYKKLQQDFFSLCTPSIEFNGNDLIIEMKTIDGYKVSSEIVHSVLKKYTKERCEPIATFCGGQLKWNGSKFVTIENLSCHYKILNIVPHLSVSKDELLKDLSNWAFQYYLDNKEKNKEKLDNKEKK